MCCWYDCTDINECSEGTHNCDHICHNNIGSFTCTCNPGATLAPNGYTCIGNGQSPNLSPSSLASTLQTLMNVPVQTHMSANRCVTTLSIPTPVAVSLATYWALTKGHAQVGQWVYRDGSNHNTSFSQILTNVSWTFTCVLILLNVSILEARTAVHVEKDWSLMKMDSPVMVCW